MSKKRRNHSPSPKAKVALEAAREERTTTEIAREYGVHVNQVSAWKRLLLAANGGESRFRTCPSVRIDRSLRWPHHQTFA